jgi:hypothetical protein
VRAIADSRKKTGGSDSRFGAVLRHASRSAGRIARAVVAASRTYVQPWRPHAPFAGWKTSGCARTSAACCSGVTFTMPRPSPARGIVAKIFPPTRKSG